MSEMAAFLNNRKPFPLVLMRNPAGSWSFVGRMPLTLAFTGSPEAIAAAAEFGLGVTRHLGAETRTWPTEAEALAAAKELGHEVSKVLK